MRKRDTAATVTHTKSYWRRLLDNYADSIEVLHQLNNENLELYKRIAEKEAENKRLWTVLNVAEDKKMALKATMEQFFCGTITPPATGDNVPEAPDSSVKLAL